MISRSHFGVHHALSRVAWATAFGILAAVATPSRAGPGAAILSGLDGASLVLCLLSWILIAPSDAAQTRLRAGSEDPGRTWVYTLVLAMSASTLLGATVLVHDARSLGPGARDAILILCVLTVALSWATTHTAFTLRYAHLYYREDAEGVGGVSIPGDAPPTYFDFAYLAFTIGMCFQVSDITVTSVQIRRAVLFHALISFGYNTVILAFVLNLVFGVAG